MSEAIAQLKAGSQVDSMWIQWEADEHPELTAHDFEWVFEPNFPIIEIGGQAFIDKMRNWLDEDIVMMLGDDLEDASIEEVAKEYSRVAGWMQLDKDLKEDGQIKEPVQIAMVHAWREYPARNSICDGWHRVAAAIKYGHEHIPAFVGRRRF